jgi:hypothetical protein
VTLSASDTASEKAVSVLGDDLTLSYSYTFTIAVKYIRREIRTLSDQDRETVLNAMVTLYNTDDVTGKTLYGEKYMSMETFLWFHLKNAGTSDCDHWHDGAGFVNHHAAITLAFEQSLQAINPSISLPYWEYAYDAMVYDDYRDSPFFADDWFGEASPNSADHSLVKGKFAGISMPDGSLYTEWRQSESTSMNPFTNPYGYMRTPWNMNKSPYFGRHNLTYDHDPFCSLPTCVDMYDCYSSSNLADVSYLYCVVLLWICTDSVCLSVYLFICLSVSLSHRSWSVPMVTHMDQHISRSEALGPLTRSGQTTHSNPMTSV